MPRFRTVFIFSGQGSQYARMGAALFEQNAEFRRRLLELDEIAKALCGRSVVAELYAPAHSRSAVFERTLFTHPAIYMVECALAHALARVGVNPDVTLGVSLGTFAAAAVAGMADEEDLLRAVISHAQALESSCTSGGMITILDSPELYRQPSLSDRCELAAVNYNKHFVVSAPHEHLADIERELSTRGIMHLRLPVQFAFHSRWVDAAREPYRERVGRVTTRRGVVPVLSADIAGRVERLPDDCFWSATRRPMRFAETIEVLEREGPCRYVDLGPSGTLSILLKYVLPTSSPSQARAVMMPYGRDLDRFANLGNADATTVASVAP